MISRLKMIALIVSDCCGILIDLSNNFNVRLEEVTLSTLTQLKLNTESSKLLEQVFE